MKSAITPRPFPSGGRALNLQVPSPPPLPPPPPNHTYPLTHPPKLHHFSAIRLGSGTGNPQPVQVFFPLILGSEGDNSGGCPRPKGVCHDPRPIFRVPPPSYASDSYPPKHIPHNMVVSQVRSRGADGIQDKAGGRAGVVDLFTSWPTTWTRVCNMSNHIRSDQHTIA